jgi:3-phenylpropionate/trans-cinnamate dioxygenase ferredoxin reductase component
MERYELVVVGGGLASAKAVEAYREHGGEGAVLLLSADRYAPYHRPPLSKRLLREEQEPEEALVQPESWYTEQRVDLRLETHVRRLDVGRRVLVEDGGEIGFDQLLIATGAHPRTLDGALTLRTIDDSLAIRESAQAAGRATVIGTGFIGLEVTASLRALGVEVTLSTGGRPLFESFRSPDFSTYLDGLYREEGVQLVEQPPEGSAAVVAGIGVVPTTDWLESSGLELDDGVVVDERFRTSADGVYAAGDVARFYDAVFGHPRRIEHWSNANYQGTEVGKILAGAEGGYDTVSSFFTELFGKTFRVFGEPGGETELEGSFEAGRAIVRYREGGRLVGALTTGLEDDEVDELRTAIRESVSAR